MHSSPVPSLAAYARAKMAEISAQDLTRVLHPTARGDRLVVERDGRRLVSFSCNDYLGLSRHPKVIAAAVAATRTYGAGAGASRYVTGDNPLYGAVEARLARIKGADGAIVFGSGYLANLGIIPALLGDGDLIVGDALMHACMHGGSRLSRARILLFRHNDAGHCAEILAAERAKHRHCLVMTEGVFSMDGDRAPVKRLAEIAKAHDAWLFTDDAHALGVIGEGRGSGHSDKADGEVPLQMGTLSKAVGAYGGYLCADADTLELVRHRARSLIYSTGLPPAALGAADAALELIETDAELVAKPLAKARLFTSALNLPAAESAVVPVMIGTPKRALDAADRLADAGFMVVAIRPPTVPDGTSRLRVTFSAAHDDADVLRLAEAVRKLGLAS
ncbi:MAG TPA: 8-amino-7-oxononanoate synthase [Alphaproteobacteria bacterium]|jgi:8-amino-7-oxononanoate synthase